VGAAPQAGADRVGAADPRGQVQNATGAVTVVADRLGRVDLAVGSRSRDFR
jgi:hypothetical protein